MVLTSIEKIFIGYGVVIVTGTAAFIGARYKIHANRDDVIAARERITKAVAYRSKVEEIYPASTVEAKKKFYRELQEKKVAAALSAES